MSKNHLVVYQNLSNLTWKILFSIFLILYLTSFTFSQEINSAIRISEFMADGNRTFADEDGDYPDWIEIFNAGTETVNLEGWHLTDDPANPTLWTFPKATLEPGKFLLVFASGKDHAVANKPLHTNFRLDAAGEHLSLVHPDGQTIIHQYAPYPDQNVPKDNFSYGEKTKTFSFISASSPIRVIVPNDDSLGQSWIDPNFNHSSWDETTLGIGYGTTSGEFTVTVYLSNTDIRTLDTAFKVMDDPNLQIGIVSEKTTVINYMDSQLDGHFTDNTPFPGQTATQDVNNFVLHATANILIPETGVWTFSINSDDGAQLRIDGKDVIVDNTTHAPKDTFASVNLPAGDHLVELIYFERSGGAEVELSAAKGQFSSFQSSSFKLIGDSGGLGLEGFSSLIGKDMLSAMKDKTNSAYLRIPFEIDDVTLDYNLLLRMRYNDGFIAYLNGQKIASRNAPDNTAWDSTSTAPRSISESLALDEISLTDTVDIIKPGANLLAIHGLNHSIDDNEFLIQAELSGIAVLKNEQRFFNPPTPGSINGEGVIGFVNHVQFSHKHGFYDNPFNLELTTTDEEDIIRFTTDGSEPSTENGTVYTGSILIDKTTPLRARVVKPDYEPGDIHTQTYIFLDDVFTQTRPDSYPTKWGGDVTADYDVDPDVVNNSNYRSTIKDDMKSLPIMSIVTDPDNLFDSRTGIYVNTNNKGVAWERPSSTEFFFPDDSQPGFQINNGIRIQGGYSRTPDKKKHSFRMLFKRDYGPATLRYKMFDNSPVDKFDQLVLRGGYNYTWHGGEGGFGSTIGRADYLRDELSRRCQLSTGQIASHGRFVHLYLNGLYWGVYDLCERPDDGFGAEYFGGEKEEYDVVTSGTRGINTTQVKAGDKDAWNVMMSLARAGGFQDNSKYEAIQQYVDIDSLIDYMLVIYFTGNRDAPTKIGGDGTPWNFYSNRRRQPGAGFNFFCWDSEWTLEEPDRNVITFHTKGYDDPSFIFRKLISNNKFKMRLADHIHQHFFNDGGLTSQAATARYQELVDIMYRPIVGESARWGDAKSGSPKTRDNEWLTETNRLLTTYFPIRTKNVLSQLKNVGYYPNVPAPLFNQHGGIVEYNFDLQMTLEEAIDQQMLITPLIKIDDSWKYNQSGSDLGDSWKNPDYNDAQWPSGKALLYYENTAMAAQKNTELNIGQVTYYFRKEFNISNDIDLDLSTYEINTFVDDGLIVYINGVEALRVHMPGGAVNHNTFANLTVTNAKYEGPFIIPKELLQQGKNIIAVEVHQVNATSSDIVFGLSFNASQPQDEQTLIPIYYTLDGSDPRLNDGTINTHSATQFNNSVLITENSTIKTRTFFNGDWSALNQASFLVKSPPASIASITDNLRITEVMYNPAESGDFEFIELHNSHPTSDLSLNGLAFTNGIEMIINNGVRIPANGYILVSRAASAAEFNAFREYYGLDSSTTIIGPYSGKLSNSGEQITLSTIVDNQTVISFDYSDERGWPIAADGAGHSIAPLASAMPTQQDGSLDYGRNWLASFAIGGSPASHDPNQISSIVINEFLANSYSEDDASSNDWIELYNNSSSTIHLGDWHLSDDDSDLRKWALPAIEIPAGGFISFEEETDFNNPSGSGFGLSKDGESLYLSYLPGQSGVDRVVDAVSFKAQHTDRTLGRFEDGDPFMVAMPLSKNQSNASGNPDIIINEIMYYPQEQAVDSLETPIGEFIEIMNPTVEIVEFKNENGAWRIDGGVDFTFPNDAILNPGDQLLIVDFDPADQTSLALFKTEYGLMNSDITILGPYEGKLSNKGERIALEQPQSIEQTDEGGNISWNIIDEAIYFHTAPWPIEASGHGMSLQRLSSKQSGNDPANWTATMPSPGAIATSIDSWMVY